jgi:glycosyltransferase 2 family protein
MSSVAELQKNRKGSSLRRLFILLAKIIITVLCFWYITTKIDFTRALAALTRANPFYLFMALVLFVVSKILSALRLNINFRNIGLHLPEKENRKLYWLGMFYNLFLPGAISGDAYKVILLNRRRHAPYKKTSVAVLLDRFSGVLALGIILAIYGMLVFTEKSYGYVLIAGAMGAILVFYLIIKYVLKDFLPGFVSTLLWGLAVQACQVVCIYCIVLSLGLPLQQEWIFIFLASAVISILPISLGGGLGTREVVFAEGARFFHLDPQWGVVISLLFYLVTVMGSIWGVYFNFHDPFGKKGTGDETADSNTGILQP